MENNKSYFKKIFNEIETRIRERLIEFDKIRIEKNKDRLFEELIFCLLTPQSKARNAEKTINILKEKNLLFSDNIDEISNNLNLVRFKNNKAKNIVSARIFFEERYNEFYNVIFSDQSIDLKRLFLYNNIKGFGIKESSHYLRNIGFYKDIAIIDRHVLRTLLEFNYIESIPKSINLQKYREIETIFFKFAKDMEIEPHYLDFIMLYRRIGDVFK